MGSHSKWANYPARKGRQDKLRAKVFSKSQEKSHRAKMGEPARDKTPRLRLCGGKGQGSPCPRTHRCATRKPWAESEDLRKIRYEG